MFLAIDNARASDYGAAMTYMTDISNSADIIDSRDVIARITELEALRDDEDTPKDFGENEAEELSTLLALAEEGEDYCEDWTYGAALIRYSYFTDYARDFADDIGAIDANASWPLSHIDWDAAADELKMDYTPVNYGGVEYYVR